MTATVTETLKRQLATSLFNDIGDSANNFYYIGLGKTTEYNSGDTVVTPTLSRREERMARLEMQSVMRVVDYSFVVPRTNWVSDSFYSSYDDYQSGYPEDEGGYAYYVITDQNSVYICVEQSRSADGTPNRSVTKPTSTASTIFATSDGYKWKFLYQIDAPTADSYISANYMPVQNILLQDSSLDTIAETAQRTIQNTAIKGQILNIQIQSGGSGYSSAPTIAISGDGDSAGGPSALATCTVSDGQVKSVTMTRRGSGYTRAKVAVSTGNAQLRSVIGHPLGVGKNPINDLKSSSMMFVVKPNGDQDSDFQITLNDDAYKIRQVMLLKNPIAGDSASIPWLVDSDNYYKGSTGRANKAMKVSSLSGLVLGTQITGGTSGASAIIDNVSGNRIFFHQDSNTGFGTFTNTENLTGSPSGSAVIASLAKADGCFADINPLTGDLLLIDNRAAVQRSAGEQQDLKIVITI
jgi:hypothetical protein